MNEPSCAPLEAVTHTTHISQAVDIVRKGTITAGLVFDESLLKKHRMRVVWVSPNYWHNGFRYGTVQFEFKFTDLLPEMHAYYVERIQYNTPASHLLLTDRKRGNLLTGYDPTHRDGPWWHNVTTGAHYFNGYSHTLEFLIESDVNISLASKINFVTHSGEHCSIHRYNPTACAELGLGPQLAGSYFVARIVGERLASKIVALLTEDSAPGSALQGAWRLLNIRLRSLVSEYSGPLTTSHDSSRAVSRALLRAYGVKHTRDLRALGALFHSQEEMMMAVQATIESAFKLDKASLGKH